MWAGKITLFVRDSEAQGVNQNVFRFTCRSVESGELVQEVKLLLLGLLGSGSLIFRCSVAVALWRSRSRSVARADFGLLVKAGLDFKRGAHEVFVRCVQRDVESDAVAQYGVTELWVGPLEPVVIRHVIRIIRERDVAEITPGFGFLIGVGEFALNHPETVSLERATQGFLSLCALALEVGSDFEVHPQFAGGLLGD
eukprot:6016571-Pleurochrysis_carterae.AAC.1